MVLVLVLVTVTVTVTTSTTAEAHVTRSLITIDKNTRTTRMYFLRLQWPLRQSPCLCSEGRAIAGNERVGSHDDSNVL